MLVLFRSKPDPSLDQPAEVPIASQYTEYHSQADHNFDCIDLRAPEELGLRIRHALALHTLVLFFYFLGSFPSPCGGRDTTPSGGASSEILDPASDRPSGPIIEVWTALRPPQMSPKTHKKYFTREKLFRTESVPKMKA